MRRVSCDYKIRKNTLVNNKITTVIKKRTNVQLLLWQGNLRGPMFRQLVIYLSLKRQRTTFIHSFFHGYRKVMPCLGKEILNQ